jgi:hypothetical protein
MDDEIKDEELGDLSIRNVDIGQDPVEEPDDVDEIEEDPISKAFLPETEESESEIDPAFEEYFYGEVEKF